MKKKATKTWSVSFKWNHTNFVYCESQSYFKHWNIQIVEFISMGNLLNQPTKTVSVKTLVAIFRFWNFRQIYLLQHPLSVTNLRHRFLQKAKSISFLLESTTAVKLFSLQQPLQVVTKVFWREDKVLSENLVLGRVKCNLCFIKETADEKCDKHVHMSFIQGKKRLKQSWLINVLIFIRGDRWRHFERKLLHANITCW